ncbi:Mitochondrial acidic protein MAM33 [Lachnellula suecica]|uniref:Mitochondrial acidic protein MAM33 n=1 Tax=Lachnellula suecica TaxID=602035 RepID=A0A8T9C1G9_9HELO|nr:Mitochondrial acidic protein MAM33 [Lachnellula suecica]
MPKSLEKTRKKITKKKGSINALHENSRDSQRLRRALMRDDKLLRVASARRKNDKPLVVRAAYFRDVVRENDSKTLEMDAIQSAIKTFVHQHDEEFNTLKKERRPGRPTSTREDLLRIKIAADEKEYETGFYLPDLTDTDNIVFLERWDGDWSYLSTLKWVRISSSGLLQHHSALTHQINTTPSIIQLLPSSLITSKLLIMLSIRLFARAAPRTVSRFATSAIRQSAPRVSLLQAAWKPAPTQATAAFSSSAPRRSKAGESDDELIAKLESELEMENEMKDQEGLPPSVKDYLENGPFEVIDTPGQEDVVLTRQFGDEKIQITFSIADINNLNDEESYEDPAMADEEENINQGEGKDFKVAPEDQIEGDQEGEASEERSYPARLNIIIEKAGKGALNIESIVQDGVHLIDNVYHYADASFAHAKTPEKLQSRQEMYAGPPYSNLDENLQMMLERYLDERGVNAALAIFVPDYIDMKEQKEYLRWLSNVKDFVAA